MKKNFFQHQIKTTRSNDLINITQIIKQSVKDSNIKEGIVNIFCPHTTAGITINENADPDVVHDILLTLNKIYPKDREYHHFEGNSDAHIKASIFGASSNIILNDGNLVLGTWQGIYFCEFDGPRSRKFYIKILEG